MTRLLALTLAIMIAPLTVSAADAELYFIWPQDGEVLSNPVTVRFGLKNMGVAPAGTDAPNTGHHHLLIDTGLPALNVPIGKDAKHLHFGGGQTETVIELSPGTHTLQLLLGNFAAYSPRSTCGIKADHHYYRVRPARLVLVFK